MEDRRWLYRKGKIEGGGRALFFIASVLCFSSLPPPFSKH